MFTFKKCLNCPDWDACASCFTIVGEQHPGHGFVEVKDPATLKQYRSVQGAARSKLHHASCDACKEAIRGVRYKCMHPSCPDYDLCDRCEALPHPVHPPTHAFLKLRSPELPISLFRAPPAPAYQVPPPPPAPVAPAPRLPSPPSFLPVIETTLSEPPEVCVIDLSNLNLVPSSRCYCRNTLRLWRLSDLCPLCPALFRCHLSCLARHRSSRRS